VIRFADVALGTGGEVRCSRCHGEPQAASYRPADDVAAEVAMVCARWEGRPGPNVAFTGAEPFGHPELPMLVAAAKEARCRRLCLDTDAVALRSQQNAGGSLMAGVRHLRWTLLGGTPGLHDALVGTPGALEASGEGVRSFLSTAAAEEIAVSVTAVVPVCRHNAHDLPAAAGLAVDAGVDRVLLRVGDGGLDLGSALPWIVAACDTGVVNGVWVEVEGVPFCLLSGYDLHSADAVRRRQGAKPPVCASCALDRVCAGAPTGASADQLAMLAPPSFATKLAASVLRAREVDA
jgi:pyruvate-formate lyase-activating enzyme